MAFWARKLSLRRPTSPSTAFFHRPREAINPHSPPATIRHQGHEVIVPSVCLTLPTPDHWFGFSRQKHARKGVREFFQVVQNPLTQGLELILSEPAAERVPLACGCEQK